MSKEAGAPESDRLDGAPHPREQVEFFGHEAAEQAMLAAYRQNRMAQAWIIGGPEGVGKATLAWRLARFLLAHPDASAPQVQKARSLFVPTDSPAARQIATMALADIFLLRRGWNEKTKKFYTEIRIDDVRDVIHALHRGSGTGGWRVAIVDCADDLNRSSANALLKLIEEPPERALFLLIAHQPGRLLPTIRSRCRRLLLEPMQPADIAKAVETLGPPYAQTPAATINEAAERAQGSVREALRLLDGDSMLFDRTLRALFERLPQLDWSAVHALAEKLTGRDNESAYETFMRALYRFLDARMRAQAGEGATRLIGYASAWEEIAQAARETEVFNFDKKALVLGIFERLEKAARG
jgi:DNA polymerase-3 subunit delta'